MPNEAMASLVFDAAINHGPNRAIACCSRRRGWQHGTAMEVGAADGGSGREGGRNAVGFVDDYLLGRERFYRWIVHAIPNRARS